jgi:hypothetical protein
VDTIEDPEVEGILRGSPLRGGSQRVKYRIL